MRDALCKGLFYLTLGFGHPAAYLARLHTRARADTSGLLPGAVLLAWYPFRGASLACWWGAQRVGRRYA